MNTEQNHGDQVRLRAIVQGRVQGVGFRYFAQEQAIALNLTGWVRNLWDGNVETVAEGPRIQVEKFLAALNRGPRSAYVREVSVEWQPATGEFKDFRVRATSV